MFSAHSAAASRTDSGGGAASGSAGCAGGAGRAPHARGKARARDCCCGERDGSARRGEKIGTGARKQGEGIAGSGMGRGGF